MRSRLLALTVLTGGLCAKAAQTDDVSLDGKVDSRVETGYLSSSGTLIDTRPSLEHQLDLTLHLAEYGIWEPQGVPSLPKGCDLRVAYATHWRQVGWETPGNDNYAESGFFTDQTGTSIGERQGKI